MTEVGFYHLQRTTLIEALPRLLEKAVAGGFRILLKVPSETEAERLALALWTYGEGSFLPHGTAKDGYEGEQPIFLTESDRNPNGADLICQVGGAEIASLDPFKRAVDMFDGNDPEQLAAARARWKRYKDGGHAVSYWQQKPNSGWERKA